MNLVDLMEDDDLLKEAKDTENQDTSIYELHNDEEADEALARIVWARKKLEEAEKKYKEKEALIKQQLADYKKRLTASLEGYEEFQSQLLHGYLVKQLGDKKGTLKLLHGNARLSEYPESVVIDDEEALLKYIAEHKLKSCVKVKVVPQKTLIKKALKKDAAGRNFVNGDDIVPGVHIEKEAGLKLSITPAKVNTSNLENVI